MGIFGLRTEKVRFGKRTSALAFGEWIFFFYSPKTKSLTMASELLAIFRAAVFTVPVFTVPMFTVLVAACTVVLIFFYHSFHKPDV